MFGTFIQLVGPDQNLQIGGVKLLGFNIENIGIASSTYDIVGFPPLKFDSAAKAESQNA